MREVVTNTSPLLYLHQLGNVEILGALYSEVLVPQGVIDELEAELPGLSACSSEAKLKGTFPELRHSLRSWLLWAFISRLRPEKPC